MQTLDIVLPVNGLQQFAIGGSYFELVEGDGAVTVAFENEDGSRAGDLEMRDALPGYWVQGPFSRFELLNRHPVQQTVRVMYGRGVGGSRRVQGAVQVIEGGTQKTTLNMAFVSPVGAPTVAAQQPYCQVWNARSDGKRVAIKTVYLSAPVAGSLNLLSADQALVNFQQEVRSKSIGQGVIAGVQVRYQNSPVTLGLLDLGLYEVQANQTLKIELQEPFVLPPGTGLTARHLTATVSLNATFEGFLL